MTIKLTPSKIGSATANPDALSASADGPIGASVAFVSEQNYKSISLVPGRSSGVLRDYYLSDADEIYTDDTGEGYWHD